MAGNKIVSFNGAYRAAGSFRWESVFNPELVEGYTEWLESAKLGDRFNFDDGSVMYISEITD